MHRAEELIKQIGKLDMPSDERHVIVGAEIGVHKGETSAMLLKALPGLRLYMVDMWTAIGVPPQAAVLAPTQSEMFAAMREAIAVTEFAVARTTLLRGLSLDVVNVIRDGDLDFVFIDADHRYECVLAELKTWYPKVRAGGLLSGHDWRAQGYINVEGAVRDFRREWQLVTPELELGDDDTWFFIKPAA